MFSPRRLLPTFLAASISTAPAFAATPAKSLTLAAPTQSGWNFEFAEDALESNWSYRAALAGAPNGEARVVFARRDAQNFSLLRLEPAAGKIRVSLFQIESGRTVAATSALISGAKGELTLQKVGSRVRALLNGNVIAQISLKGQSALSGGQLGWASRGAFKLGAGDLQPTEAALFRDDFMRADGPDAAATPGEWQVVGNWKTSGSLGPKSDASLNPNPFVFRAESKGNSRENVARAGKWWWSDYSVSASVRAIQGDETAPLRAGIEAFSAPNGSGIRGEVDFARGIAVLRDGDRVLATSAPFEVEANGWHRLMLQPGPGTAKFYVDGTLRVAAPSTRAQGAVSLRAMAGNGSSGANSIDFDDVRVGALAGHELGEGALPARFQKDRLMRNWASDASAWKRDASGIWWHTGDFFGAAKLDMTPPKLEVGDGFEVFLAADPQNVKAGLRYTIVRPDEKPEIDFRLALRNSPDSVGTGMKKRLPLQDEETLHFNLTRAKPGFLRAESALGLHQWRTEDFPLGTKIGFRPLKNNQPVPPPSLQAVSLSSVTFEREGRAVIGVNITPMSLAIAREIGLADATGAVVDNVEAGSPAALAGVREGDVIKGIEGARVTDVESMRAAVGAVKAGTAVRIDILRPQVTDAGVDLAKCVATTPDVLDYSFTAAPVDWRAASGSWNIAERWTCSPQWSFFAGQGDISPTLWSRFATQGDYTLEAYLATPMDLTRSERGPSDLNVSVGGDGVDLASGYSFVFGGNGRSVNQIWRGDAVAKDIPFEMPAGAGDTHQDWFYVRLERRQTAGGVRFKWSVNGREMATYLDPNPLADGGRIAFWTQNGALSMARVRLWNAGARPASVAPFTAPPSTPWLQNGLGIWSARGAGRDASAQIVLASQSANGAAKISAQPTIEIVNPRSGGDWTTYVTRAPFKPLQTPSLEWDYRVPAGVKLNLYALVDNSWREIGFTGGLSANGNSASLGSVAGVLADGKWHHASFDLAGVLRSKGVNADTVDALAFAAPAHDYVRSGLGGNHRGATYWLRDFRAVMPVN